MDREQQGHDTEHGRWEYVQHGPNKQAETVRILPEGDPAQAPQPSPAAPRSLQPYDPAPLPPAGRPSSTETLGASAPTSPSTQPQAHAVVQVKRGPSACAIIAGTFGVLALACALLGFATLKGGLDGLGKLGGIFPNFGLVTTPTVTINVGSPGVVTQIRNLSKLESVNYQVDKVVSGKSSGPLPDFFTSDKILLVAHGEVVAGIDLSNITAADVSVVSNTVTITMPKTQILYSKLDNDKTYVYDRETGLLNKPDPNLETQLRKVAEQEILKSALEEGILANAQTNAEQVLRTLLTGLGYTDVRFKEQP